MSGRYVCISVILNNFFFTESKHTEIFFYESTDFILFFSLQMLSFSLLQHSYYIDFEVRLHDLVLITFKFPSYFESYFDTIICLISTEP